MLEYDQNLPQEFNHKPSRVSTGILAIGLALATISLVYALVVLLPLIARYRV